MRTGSKNISTTITLIVLFIGGAYFVIRNWDESPPPADEVVLPPEVEEFYRVVQRGHFARAKEMLDHNPMLIQENYPDIGTAIHVAASSNQVDMIRLLLSRGAQVESIGKSGGTPLHWAAYHGKVQATEFLIKNGADVNARCEKYRAGPILWAANGSAARGADQSDYSQIARALLQNGADPNIRMLGGMPAITVASQDFAEVMIEFGANTFGRDETIPNARQQNPFRQDF
jgi:ankyrin repeat protein